MKKGAFFILTALAIIAGTLCGAMTAALLLYAMAEPII